MIFSRLLTAVAQYRAARVSKRSARLLTVLLLSAGFMLCGPLAGYSWQIAGEEAGSWPAILSSIGLVQGRDGLARVIIIPAGSNAPAERWIPILEQGAVLVLEGESPLATALGIRPEGRRFPVRNAVDLRRPDIPVIWQRQLELPRYSLPSDARLLMKERWNALPLMASVRRGSGAALWMAVPPGASGYERFPWLLQALNELGVEAPVRTNRLWAFFDSSYRARADLDYLVERWRRAGISTLHVAAWHYFDPDQQRDQYLARLIEACHRQAILVYAWLELPHVSERFWDAHPEWREKTALLQDAHLDWRKLMNLQSRDCFRAVTGGVAALVERFDWDGVNLAELYFESLEGADNPARFTPMNDTVRAEFRAEAGFDPIEIFGARKNDAAAFLDYRARLAARMQQEWIGQLQQMRRRKPHLELVLTHVDDRFEPRMRELIGADAGRLLPELDRTDLTFLVEDPATIWHLGPQRYSQIAEKYAPLTPHRSRLAIDINIVERYQDVYPTKQQTGTELFQLVHLASSSFPRVALYFENSILREDLSLLPAAGANVSRLEQAGGRLVIESPHGEGLRWSGAALVNGKPWPVYDGDTVWLPAGLSAVDPAQAKPPMRILYFNGGLRTAAVIEGGVEFSYHSDARSMAVLEEPPARLEIDGFETKPQLIESGARWVLLLPRGQHIVSLFPAVRPPAAAGATPSGGGS